MKKLYKHCRNFYTKINLPIQFPTAFGRILVYLKNVAVAPIMKKLIQKSVITNFLSFFSFSTTLLMLDQIFMKSSLGYKIRKYFCNKYYFYNKFL